MKLKNSEWCADFGSKGATCYNTMKPDTRRISKEDWDQERFGQLCTQAPVFADWKAAIEKLCSVSKRCTYEQEQAVKRFFSNVEQVKRRTEQLR